MNKKKEDIKNNNDISIFSEKFNNYRFIEKWEKLPTSTNIELFSTNAFNSINSKRNSRVLDLCCGTGKGTIYLAFNWNVGEITYVDQSKTALEMAREVISNHHRSSLISTQFICQPAELLDKYDLGSFDSIIIRYAIHLLNKPHILLSNLYRILNPGGRIVFNFAGSNIYNFSNPNFNAVPNFLGQCHPFFGAVYMACKEIEDDIILAVPSSDYNHLVSIGALQKMDSGDYKFGTRNLIKYNIAIVRKMIFKAGIPQSNISYDLTWLRASFGDKASYAYTFGAPPIPGIWSLFNTMSKDIKIELTQKIMNIAQKRLSPKFNFYFPEPIFTITRD
ncbi:MAG: class I SAM-dependent methyltransferase [Sedimentisphaerales bacterium]|nr:class I SAM-dependent methyltransferase [Sedimentisphaerales bacterium]